MELEDCAYPNLVNVVCTTDPLVAFDNADVCVLVGGFPRKKGENLSYDMHILDLPFLNSHCKYNI